jgi:hypothetical protein
LVESVIFNNPDLALALVFFLSFLVIVIVLVLGLRPAHGPIWIVGNSGQIDFSRKSELHASANVNC